jgi:hypothetical protein
MVEDVYYLYRPPKYSELQIKTASFMIDSREHPYCSVYSRYYAAIVKWAVISDPFLRNGSVNTFPRQRLCMQRGVVYAVRAEEL